MTRQHWKLLPIVRFKDALNYFVSDIGLEPLPPVQAVFGTWQASSQVPPTATATSVTEHMLVEASIHSEPVKMQGRDS